MTLKLSVVCATFDRGKLLDKALRTYVNQTLPYDEWEYIIVDDGSQDDTKAVVEKYIEKGLPLVYLDAAEDCGLKKELGQWRDGCKVRNVGSTFAHGNNILLTHPEIMIPPDALESMVRAITANPVAWVTAIPYWLPKSGMTRGWQTDINKLREMKGFYHPDWPNEITAPGAIDYTNGNQETRETWESEVFSAMSMAQWRAIGGFRHFDVWGSVDMDFLARRVAMGIRTVIATTQDNEHNPHKDNYLMVYHQAHASERDMDAAMKAVQNTDYSTREKALAMGGLRNIYLSGHRERPQKPGELTGVMGDHVARYEFAKNYSGDKVVLDIPCGTGYGAGVMFLNDPAPSIYFGVDIDEESIEYAAYSWGDKQNLVNAHFLPGNMLSIPLEDGEVDRVYCFEGIEHLESFEEQSLFVAEMWRVLKPTGTFIISTPQKGATRGTIWDRTMLIPKELESLFPLDDWKSLTWFFQPSYGLAKIPIQAGFPPPTAEIIILGGSKNG